MMRRRLLILFACFVGFVCPSCKQHNLPVLIIGADGLDLELVRTISVRGNLPNLNRMMREGAFGVLYSEREMRSPALWTTMATGRPRWVHQIYDFVTGSRLWPIPLRQKYRQLVTSGMRKSPAIWNMATDAGRKVSVIGWLNTWPAEPVNGLMVAPYVALGRKKQVTIKGAVYADEKRQVYPYERWREIRRLIVATEEVPESLLESFAPTPEDSSGRSLPILDGYRQALRWSLANTLTVKRITLHTLKKDKPDLCMVYFEGADSLGHRFWVFRESARKVSAAFRRMGYSQKLVATYRQQYGKVIDRYYEFLDKAIGELLRVVSKDTLVIIISDHGFGPRSGRYAINRSVPFTGEHLLEGTIIAYGKGVRPKRLVGSTQYDITPTLLDLLDLESEVEFEGKSLARRLFAAPEIALVEEPPEEKASDDSQEGEYEDHHHDTGQATEQIPNAEEEVERLRSLGYVE